MGTIGSAFNSALSGFVTCYHASRPDQYVSRNVSYKDVHMRTVEILQISRILRLNTV